MHPLMAERLKTSDFHTGGPCSNHGPTVAPFSKALYPNCLVIGRRLYAVGSLHRRLIPYARKRTHITSHKEQGDIPVRWSDGTNGQLFSGDSYY